MMNDPILIIGAGAAGLMAAYELSGAGLPVVVIEAMDRPGGRIHTIHGEGFSTPVEGGAEFVHGSLPITLGLLKAAGIPYSVVKGNMRRVRKGQWIEEDLFSGDWDELLLRMEELKEDMPIENFLQTWFADERYALLRDSIRGFAEGYDLVDVRRASTLALYHEWQEEGQAEFRLDGGYDKLVEYLIEQCLTRGCVIRYGAPVVEIQWRTGRVEVSCASGHRFTGVRLITTVSLGVLQIGPGLTGALQFTPEIPAYRQAVREMGFGEVIKVLMEFREPFWSEKGDSLGFILSDETVPTWWTQSSSGSHLLTAWVPARAMHDFRVLDDRTKLEACIRSLSGIFGVEMSLLRSLLVAFKVCDWTQIPYVRGGYSYETVGSETARARMRQPVDDTLYFAGEALYEGTSLATVEAALHSGREVGQLIIKARP